MVNLLRKRLHGFTKDRGTTDGPRRETLLPIACGQSDASCLSTYLVLFNHHGSSSNDQHDHVA